MGLKSALVCHCCNLLTSGLTLANCRAGSVALSSHPVSPTAGGFKSHSFLTLVSRQNGYWKEGFFHKQWLLH